MIQSLKLLRTCFFRLQSNYAFLNFLKNVLSFAEWIGLFAVFIQKSDFWGWSFQSWVQSEPPTRQISLKNTTLKVVERKDHSVDLELHRAELLLVKIHFWSVLHAICVYFLKSCHICRHLISLMSKRFTFAEKQELCFGCVEKRDKGSISSQRALPWKK